MECARNPVSASVRCGIAVLALALFFLSAAFTQGTGAQARAAKGRELLAQGDVAGAERELRAAVGLDPSDPEASALLGVALGMQRKLQESDRFLEKALRLDPADSVTRRNLAWNQFDLGELASSKANLVLLLKQNPRDSTATVLMGMVEEEQRHFPSALKLLSSVPEQVRAHPEALAALARAYSYTGQPVKAQEVLKEVQFREAPPESIFSAAQVAGELNDFTLAESMLQSIAKTYPDPEKWAYAMGRIQYRAGRVSQSLETLRSSVAAGHDSAEIENLLAWCLFKRGDAKGAVAALDRAIALDPGEESNYLDVGMMLLENHFFEGALAAAEKAIAVAPGSSAGRRLKGLVEFRLGHVKDAESTYRRALELNPSDVKAVIGLATAQLDVGKNAEAEATLKKAIEHQPKAAALYQAYGTMLLWGEGKENNQIEAHAIELLRKAESLDGSLPDAHYELGKLALREGNLREALQELELAVKLDPKGAKYHYSLSQVYRKLGRMTDADQEVLKFQDLKNKEAPHQHQN